MELSNDLLKLNPKEIQVLKLVAAGKRSKQISEMLGISPRTVEQRLANIMEKIEAKTAAQAVAIGIRTGIIA